MQNQNYLKGSGESLRSRSMCCRVISINSSQYGGFTWNDPDTGLNSRNGLCRWKNKKPLITASFGGRRIVRKLPARTKICVRITKCRTKLAKITVQRAGKAFEGNAELSLQALKHTDRQRWLRLFGFMRLMGDIAQIGLIATQQAPDSRYKQIEFFIVMAIVTV